MDALHDIISNIPKWQHRLRELQSETDAAASASLAVPSPASPQTSRIPIASAQPSAFTADHTSHPTTTAAVIYYNGDVQMLFTDLVGYASLNRSMMRKAKMAAKVAHIKRMAESDAASDVDVPLAVVYRTSAASKSEDFTHQVVYDGLDRHLTAVHNVAEDAAHQFLRYAQCSAELARLQDTFKAILQLARGELDRLHFAGAERDALEGGKPRIRRSISIRRDMPNLSKETLCEKQPQQKRQQTPPVMFMDGPMTLEVDLDVCPQFQSAVANPLRMPPTS